MMRKILLSLGVWFLVAGSLHGQMDLSNSSEIQRSEQSKEYGTCAVTAFTDSRIAFVIDSRITQTSGNRFVGQVEGCKVALVRPSILIAATGIEDAQLGPNHWNALVEAKKSLSAMPENPTRSQLFAWGLLWATTLTKHYQESGYVPDHVGVLSQLLLLTKVDGESFIFRATTSWDGRFFSWGREQFGVSADATKAYSGLCKSFVNSNAASGPRIAHSTSVTPEEYATLNRIGDDGRQARTIIELEALAMKFEKEFTAIDQRIEGDYAVIGKPYATAEWDRDSESWKTDFNPACLKNAADLNVVAGTPVGPH
jgi:hypothetical protein